MYAYQVINTLRQFAMSTISIIMIVPKLTKKTYQHGKIKGNVLYATVKKVSLWITPPIIQAW